MKNVGHEVDVPISVTKKAIEFALCWVVLFIAPSEAFVLKVDFLELTSIEGVSESNEAVAIHIGTVFVSSTIYLVEVPINKPSCTSGRFL